MYKYCPSACQGFGTRGSADPYGFGLLHFAGCGWLRLFSVSHTHGGIFVEEGGGGFRQPWTPQSSKCLTHTQTPQPMLRSESDRFANPMLHPATTQKDKTAVYVCARHEKESRHAQTAGLNLNFLHHLQSP